MCGDDSLFDTLEDIPSTFHVKEAWEAGDAGAARSAVHAWNESEYLLITANQKQGVVQLCIRRESMKLGQ